MTEETKKDLSSKDASKASQQAILEMAKAWRKNEKTIHHAIKAYEDVVRADPESEEAREARSELLQIAKEWQKRGQVYAANNLYKKLMLNQI
jgi:protein involved in temperature-dependent protein secretion